MDMVLDYILSPCWVGVTLDLSMSGSHASAQWQMALRSHATCRPHPFLGTAALTITLLLAFTLLVSLIARAAVQAPVQKAA